MLKRASAAVILALLACASSFGIQQPGASDPTAWQKMSSPEGRFTLLMPPKPTSSNSDVDTEVGKLKLYSYSAETAVGFFTGTYADYPTAPRDRAQAEEVLDGVRDGVLKGSGGKLISETRINIKGYPGREFTASSRVNEIDVRYAWRIYLVDRRLYQIGAGTLEKDAEHAEVARFLTSFNLIVP